MHFEMGNLGKGRNYKEGGHSEKLWRYLFEKYHQAIILWRILSEPVIRMKNSIVTRYNNTVEIGD